MTLICNQGHTIRQLDRKFKVFVPYQRICCSYFYSIDALISNFTITEGYGPEGGLEGDCVFSNYVIALHASLARYFNTLQTSPAGFEPATSGLGNQCSIQLSYGDTIWVAYWVWGPRQASALECDYFQGLRILKLFSTLKGLTLTIFVFFRILLRMQK